MASRRHDAIAGNPVFPHHPPATMVAKTESIVASGGQQDMNRLKAPIRLI